MSKAAMKTVGSKRRRKTTSSSASSTSSTAIAVPAPPPTISTVPAPSLIGVTSQSVVNPISSTNLTRPSLAAAKNVPAFLNKLYRMVNDSSTDQLIRWSDDGMSFLVLNQEEFAKELLPRFFKHNNFSSFVRQLNMYGFHKVPHLNQGVLVSDADSEQWEFTNPHFQRNQPDLLCLVTRKKGKDADEKGDGLDIGHFLSEIATIKRHQITISSDLKNIQRDNQVLWQELVSTRERYNKQQETIDKILRFLASVFSSEGKPKAIQNKKRKLLDFQQSSSEDEGDDLPTATITQLPSATTPTSNQPPILEVPDLPIIHSTAFDTITTPVLDPTTTSALITIPTAGTSATSFIPLPAPTDPALSTVTNNLGTTTSNLNNTTTSVEHVQKNIDQLQSNLDSLMTNSLGIHEVKDLEHLSLEDLFAGIDGMHQPKEVVAQLLANDPSSFYPSVISSSSPTSLAAFNQTLLPAVDLSPSLINATLPMTSVADFPTTTLASTALAALQNTSSSTPNLPTSLPLSLPLDQSIMTSLPTAPSSGGPVPAMPLLTSNIDSTAPTTLPNGEDMSSFFNVDFSTSPTNSGFEMPKLNGTLVNGDYGKKEIEEADSLLEDGLFEDDEPGDDDDADY